jgi:hypothetical protein
LKESLLDDLRASSSPQRPKQAWKGVLDSCRRQFLGGEKQEELLVLAQNCEVVTDQRMLCSVVRHFFGFSGMNMNEHETFVLRKKIKQKFTQLKNTQ